MTAFLDTQLEDAPSGKAILSERSGWEAALRKPDRRPIYEWAEENLHLPETYANPGKFRTSPWMREIFGWIQSPTVREVWVMAAIQSGKTLISDVSISWVLVNHPGPVMLTMQSEADMKEHMKTRLWPVFRSCGDLMSIMPENRHDKTTSEIYFGSHFFVANGANVNSLQSKSIQWKFNDELWLPQWQDIYIHAKGRVSAYENIGASKLVNVSQAGNKDDVMAAGYASGTRRVWEVDGRPLVFFGKREDGSRYGLTWNDDAKRPDGGINKARAIETCRYEMEDGTEWPDDARTRKHFMDDGRWSEPAADADQSIESVQFSALPTRPMKFLVSEWCDAYEASRRGDMGPMADFTRKRRSEPWEDREEVIRVSSKKSGYSLQDYWEGQSVDGEESRFMTLDRQKGMRGEAPHWWVVVRAWRLDGSSRLLYAGRIDTTEAIESLRERMGVEPRLVLQDAGHDANSVYNDCVRYGWSCAFGADRRGWEHRATGGKKVIRPYSPMTPVQQGSNRVMFFHFSTDYHKDILANLVSGSGSAFEIPDDVSDDYREQMEAESKVEVSPGKWKWKPAHSTKPNHIWDAEVMQVVLAVIRGFLAAPEPGKSRDSDK